MAGQTNEKCFPIIKSVCVYWKIIGLCPFVLAEDGPGAPSYCCMFYTTLLILAYCVAYYCAVINRMSYITTRRTSMTVIADFFGLSTEFFLVIAAWLYVTLRHRQLQMILKVCKKIQENSKTMDIDQDFRKIFKTVKFHVISMNVVWAILYMSYHLFIYDEDLLKRQIWMPFNLPRVVSYNVSVMFVDSLWIIRKFFCSLNERVQDLSRKVTTRLIIRERNGISLKIIGVRSFVTPNPLETYGQMHSDLVDLTKLIVDFFAVLITLFLLSHLILMASKLYILCLMAEDEHFLNWKRIATFTQLFCWWFLNFVQTVILIAVSESTANEANRTGSVLHAMLLDDHTIKYVDSSEMLSLRLLQKPLTIELHGLIDMRHSVTRKIIGMVVTYITIMMQLDLQDLQQQQLDNL